MPAQSMPKSWRPIAGWITANWFSSISANTRPQIDGMGNSSESIRSQNSKGPWVAEAACIALADSGMSTYEPSGRVQTVSTMLLPTAAVSTR